MKGEVLAGYKTYITGIAMIITGVLLIGAGKVEEGVELILGGLAIMNLRLGIKKLEK